MRTAAIDARPDVAALHHVREEILELALLSSHDRGKNLESRSFWQHFLLLQNQARRQGVLTSRVLHFVPRIGIIL